MWNLSVGGLGIAPKSGSPRPTYAQPCSLANVRASTLSSVNPARGPSHVPSSEPNSPREQRLRAIHTPKQSAYR